MVTKNIQGKPFIQRPSLEILRSHPTTVLSIILSVLPHKIVLNSWIFLLDEVLTTPGPGITRKSVPMPRGQSSNTISRNSVIAIIMLVVVIVLITVCVVVGFFFYKKKMSKRIEGKVIYSRRLETSKDSSGGVFDNSRQESIKFFGFKRNGRLESNSSTSSTLPLMFSRQNSFRTRLPSNGLPKVDSDICEGKLNALEI